MHERNTVLESTTPNAETDLGPIARETVDAAVPPETASDLLEDADNSRRDRERLVRENRRDIGGRR